MKSSLVLAGAGALAAIVIAGLARSPKPFVADATGRMPEVVATATGPRMVLNEVVVRARAGHDRNAGTVPDWISRSRATLDRPLFGVSARVPSRRQSWPAGTNMLANEIIVRAVAGGVADARLGSGSAN